MIVTVTVETDERASDNSRNFALGAIRDFIENPLSHFIDGAHRIYPARSNYRLTVRITDNTALPFVVSDALCLWILSEVAKRPDPARMLSLGQCNEVLCQCNDAEIAAAMNETLEETGQYDSLRRELSGLVLKYGYGYPVHKINLET